jgi:predicted metal-dependent RNase
MIMEASAIHTAYPEYLREQLQRRILSDKSPFENPMIKVARGLSKEEIVNGEPAVILAPSGMLTGGPSYEYLKMMADDPKNTLVFVGYQSQLSLGSKLQQGMRELPILGDDGKMKTLQVNMGVETAEGFSGHSDRAQLMAYLRQLRPTPERIFTLHGDYMKTEEFARAIGMMLKKESYALADLEAVRLK